MLSNEVSVSDRSTARQPTIYSISLFIVLFAAIWGALYALWQSFPYIKPGADLVYQAKFDRLVAKSLFDPAMKTRVMVFGNSQILAGFRPDVFVDAMGADVQSVNLGLPGEGRFLPLLEAAIAHGNVPTHVLLMVPWSEDPPPSNFLDWLRDDNAIVKELLPFRHMPRDLTIFLFNTRFHLFSGYAAAGREVDLMLAQRGWYFIKSQSHFPGDALPDDYTLPTDKPTVRETRLIPERSATRSRLEGLARQYGFKVVLIPRPARQGEVADNPPDQLRSVKRLSTDLPIYAVGPASWLYPNGMFSDPVHLNPSGAVRYTDDLANLMLSLGMLD